MFTGPTYAESKSQIEELTYADFIYSNNFNTEHINPSSGLVDLLSYYKKTILGFTALSIVIDTKKNIYPQASNAFQSTLETFFSVLGGNQKELVQALTSLHSSLEQYGKNNLLLCQYNVEVFFCPTTGCSFCKNPSFSDVQALFDHCWSKLSPWYCCNNCSG